MRKSVTFARLSGLRFEGYDNAWCGLFYVGYFNVTGAGGKWPNMVGSNDPRGYAYQVALPAYAQAVGSYAWDFIANGELLNLAAPADELTSFALKEMRFRQREQGRYYCYIRARARKGNEAVLRVTIEGKEIWVGKINVKGLDWKWYQLKAVDTGHNLQFNCIADQPVKIKPVLISGKASADPDKILISAKHSLPAD